MSPVLNAFAAGATEAWVNAVIPIGEVLIGLGLILGALTRTAALFRAAMMFFFYFGGEHWRHGLVNSDLLGLVLFVTILVFGVGRVWRIDSYLEQTEIVRARPWLRYLLG